MFPSSPAHNENLHTILVYAGNKKSLLFEEFAETDKGDHSDTFTLQRRFRSLFAINHCYNTICTGTGCPEFLDALPRRTP